jgi:SagB-type dehydrogenase family enzyme
MADDLLAQYRFFLRDTIRKRIDFSRTAQSRGVAPPPIEKPVATGAILVDLPAPLAGPGSADLPLTEAIANRRSRRTYLNRSLSLEGLSFLLWASQGIRAPVAGGHAYRTVPSAGCRHALETYLAVLNVDGVEQGLYRYLPLSHRLVFEHAEERLAERLVAAAFGQPYPGKAAVTFLWTAVPYRMEWRYGLAAHKVIAIDAGHVCQNLYLACEAIGAGTCAIAAYDQEAMDALLRLDGGEEFTIYMAPVGVVKRKTEK